MSFNNGLLIFPQPSLDGIPITGITAESHSVNMTITDHPMSDGMSISQGAFVKDERVTIKGIISGISPNMQGASHSSGGNQATSLIAASKLQSIVLALKKIVKNPTAHILLITHSFVLFDYIVESFEASYPYPDHKVDLTLYLKKVRVVSTLQKKLSDIKDTKNPIKQSITQKNSNIDNILKSLTKNIGKVV